MDTEFSRATNQLWPPDLEKFAEPLQFFQKLKVRLILWTISRPLGCKQMDA
jgi:hypothetical protein